MRLRALIVAFLSTALALTMAATASAFQSAGPQTITINIGGGGNGIAVNDFFPDSVTIHAGDTIHFVNPYLEIHTVTFVPSGQPTPGFVVPGPSGPPQFMINPQAANPTFTSSPASFDATTYYNSGVLNQNQAADVVFNATGTFKFICLVHGPSMSISVNIVDPTADADNQTAVDVRATAQRNPLFQQGQQLAASTKLTSETLPDGSTNWKITVGGSAAEADLVQFLPATANIKAGDTITWTNSTPTPHTVTFTSGGPEPDLLNPQPQPSGPPLLIFNPQALLPAGGNTYDGTGYLNSGFIGQGFPGQTFSVRFTMTGTFSYFCILHDDQGMKGTVNVGAGGPSAAVTAPNTGTGPSRSMRSGSWLLSGLALLVVGGAFALGGALAARRA